MFPSGHLQNLVCIEMVDLYARETRETTDPGSIMLTYLFMYSIGCGSPTQNPDNGSHSTLILALLNP